MENAEPEQQQQRDPLLNARDRLFHTLFFRLALGYARYWTSRFSCRDFEAEKNKLFFVELQLACFLALFHLWK